MSETKYVVDEVVEVLKNHGHLDLLTKFERVASNLKLIESGEYIVVKKKVYDEGMAQYWRDKGYGFGPACER